MKTIIISVLSVLIILWLFSIYTAHFSTEATKGRNNLNNAKKLRIGMGKNETESIMGKPNTIMHMERDFVIPTESEDRFLYKTNDDSHPYIAVAFDSASQKIIRITEIP